LINVGNNQGHLFTYKLDPTKIQKVENGQIVSDCISTYSQLISSSGEETIIRNVVSISDEIRVITTENNTVEVHKKKIENNHFILDPEDEEMDD